MLKEKFVEVQGCSRDQTFRDQDRNQERKIFSRPRSRSVFFRTLASYTKTGISRDQDRDREKYVTILKLQEFNIFVINNNDYLFISLQLNLIEYETTK